MRELLPKGMLKAMWYGTCAALANRQHPRSPSRQWLVYVEQVPRREEGVQGRGQAGGWIAGVRWIGGTRTAHSRVKAGAGMR